MLHLIAVGVLGITGVIALLFKQNKRLPILLTGSIISFTLIIIQLFKHLTK